MLLDRLLPDLDPGRTVGVLFLRLALEVIDEASAPGVDHMFDLEAASEAPGETIREDVDHRDREARIRPVPFAQAVHLEDDVLA